MRPSAARSAVLPEAGELPQRLLRGRRQASQPADDEFHHVVGVALRVNALRVPRPAAARRGRRQSRPVLQQRGQELDDEEWIAAGLLVHQLRRAARRARLAPQRIRNQLRHVFAWSGPRLTSCTAAPASRIAPSLRMQRVRGVDFVVAVGADQQQVAAHRAGSSGPRSDREWPHRAIADRRGTAPADAPARANTPMKRRSTSWKRRCASCGGSSVTGAAARR